MNRIIIMAILLIPAISFAVSIPNGLGLDWRTDGPNGKNWIKVTDIHYLNINSIKKVKGNIYQATLCNHLDTPATGGVWNYIKSRVDCKTREAYEPNINSNEWLGPMSPSNYDEAVMKYACK